VLRDVELQSLSPLTFFVGPNGSGKSTVLDVFAFVKEAVDEGLSVAWNRRGGMRGIRSREQTGPVTIEITFTTPGVSGQATYRVKLDEVDGEPFVRREWLRRPDPGAGVDIALDLTDGRGMAQVDDLSPTQMTVRPSVLALAALGDLGVFGPIVLTKGDIRSWYVSTLESRMLRSVPISGAEWRLTPSGDNLPNVLRYVALERPDLYAELVENVRRLVPEFDEPRVEVSEDNRLLLKIGEKAFREPVLAAFASDGTLRLLAYLAVLGLAEGYGLIGLEEPEIFLHPRLHYVLAEELRRAAERTQVLVTTHSPHLVDGLKIDELWTLYRDTDGFARAVRAADEPRLTAMVNSGGLLGDLWMEGFFGVGDPLTRGGRPHDRAAG
jgi:predicted ATPase